MPLDSSTRERLRAENLRRTEEAARMLLEENTAGAEARLKWIAVAEQVVRAGAPPPPLPRHPLLIPGLLLLLCLTLVTLAWLLHPDDNPLRMEVTAHSLRMRLAQDWEMKMKQPLDAMRVDRLRRLNPPGREEGAYRNMRLSGPQMVLQRLALPAGAVLELELRADGLRLFVKNAELEGDIKVMQARLTLVDEDGKNEQQIDTPPGMPPKVLRFTTERAPEQGNPIPLMLRAKNWRLTGLYVRGLSFTREEPPDSGQWVSSIIKASGEWLESGRKFSLPEGDRLDPEGVNSARFVIEGDQGRLKVSFQGAVDAIKAGPAGFVREITPTWLEYAYHQKQLGLLWGALLFLWGAGWKLRSLLKSKA
ncbi:MAG: hypothetical protein GY862_28495 [Gammaproteobacteria bacterium]|nr:hypothetical protein [Gammaproteobacteria bacterium]